MRAVSAGTPVASFTKRMRVERAATRAISSSRVGAAGGRVDLQAGGVRRRRRGGHRRRQQHPDDRKTDTFRTQPCPMLASPRCCP
jgi:hypothetical protein